MLQVRGQGRGELLPGEELEPPGEPGSADGVDDLIPRADKIYSATVTKNTEGGTFGIGCERIADELVGQEVTGGCARKVREIEDGFEVSVPAELDLCGALEVRFGELGFDVEAADPKINLRSIDATWGKRNTGLVSERGYRGEFDT